MSIIKLFTYDYESNEGPLANTHVHIGGKGSYGIKVHDCHSRIELDPNYYVHASSALIADFEILDNFDHIFTSLFTLF